MKESIVSLLLWIASFPGFAQGIRIPVHEDSLLSITYPGKRVTPPLRNNLRDINLSAIPANLYIQHLSFFCRQELKMQQVHLPLIFRVGSIDQCNYLEQKPGYKN